MPRNIVLRLVVYYAAWLVALGGLFRLFPSILGYVSQERDRFLIGALANSGADVTELLERATQGIGRLDNQEGIGQLLDPSLSIPVLLALILAFGVTLPITWVYQWTRPPKKHNQSFVHALLVTPIGIALVVFLVKGSLPLAFGLAGIVAAVRFRATIKEPMDVSLHVDGHRHRTRDGHAAYRRGLPCLADVRRDHAGGVEEQLRCGVTRVVRVENRFA